MSDPKAEFVGSMVVCGTLVMVRDMNDGAEKVFISPTSTLSYDLVIWDIDDGLLAPVVKPDEADSIYEVRKE